MVKTLTSLMDVLSAAEPFAVLATTVAPSRLSLVGGQLLAAIVFSVVGLAVFFGALVLMEKLTPYSIVKEIGEEHNTAMAIIVGAIVMGISVIIAAAVLG